MIDIILLSLYLLITLGVGIYNRNRTQTLSSYSHLGNALSSNRFILTATIFASAVGGGTTFGLSEKAFSQNLSFVYGLLLTIPIDLLIAKYLVPRMAIYSEVNSIGEIIGKYYGKKAQIITGIAASLISIGYLSVQISVSGRIFSFLFNINYVSAVIISYIVVITYTTIGGLKSVVVNNSLQFLAMILTIPVVTILGINYVGFSEFIAWLPEEKYNLATNHDLLVSTIYAMLSFSVMGFYPSLIQRILAGKNQQIQQAIYFKSAIYALFIICLSLNGLLALKIVPDSPIQLSLTNLINVIIPIGLKGVIVIGLLATVMSTADSDLNITSISLVNDVLKPLGFTSKDQKKLLFTAKLLSIFVGSSVILIVMRFESIVELIIFSAGLWAPLIVVPLVGILFKKIISPLGFYFCCFIGAAVFAIFEIALGIPAISGVFMGTLASLLAFVFFYKTRASK